MDYYASEWGFGAGFETKVAAELAHFIESMQSEHDLLTTAWLQDRLVGSIVVDHTVTGGDGAHLRWFITAPAARGTGLGKKLLCRAVEFADDRGYDHIWLTTFAGLDAARALYEKAGFRLMSEQADDQWQGGVREQRFERRRTQSPT